MTEAKRTSLRGEHVKNLYDYLHDAGYRLKWDESRGYSAAFAKKHDEILKDIIENPGKIVRLVAGFDDICNCGACPKKGAQCQSPQLLEKDRSVAQEYGLEIGGEYMSRELVKLLGKRKGA
jgi:hypothetical protein